MKQFITIDQLNELSEKGKERLREWWKPKEGDWYFIPKGIQYGSGYGHWEETLWEKNTIHCLGYGELSWGEGGTVKYAGKVKFDSISYGEYGDDNYFEIPIKSVYPLLSIAQMIEFLDGFGYLSSSNLLTWETHREPNWLCDALWEAVEEVLEVDKIEKKE